MVELHKYMHVMGTAPKSALFPDKVTLVCEENLKFDDTTSTQTMQCMKDGTWAPITHECRISPFPPYSFSLFSQLFLFFVLFLCTSL